MKRLFQSLVISAVLSYGCGAHAGTLENVKQADVLRCGGNGQLAGFGLVNSQGGWTGMDVDFCRALAAAVLSDPDKGKMIPVTTVQRFPAIQANELDLLTHTVTATLTREAEVGLLFTDPLFYDGQGFMVKKEIGITSAKDISGATVCIKPGTVTELNLADFARVNNVEYQPVVIEQVQQIVEAFLSDRCQVLTDDGSALAAVRSEQSNPDDFVILPEVISKEPLSPVVRADDGRWFMVVRWVLHALIAAEELGVTQANVDEMKNSENPDIQRLLGVTGDLGAKLGLDNAWAYNAIKAVGNYGEIFERNVGQGSELKLNRGLNALWTQGGLMYSNPIR